MREPVLTSKNSMDLVVDFEKLLCENQDACFLLIKHWECERSFSEGFTLRIGTAQKKVSQPKAKAHKYRNFVFTADERFIEHIDEFNKFVSILRTSFWIPCSIVRGGNALTLEYVIGPHLNSKEIKKGLMVEGDDSDGVTVEGRELDIGGALEEKSVWYILELKRNLISFGTLEKEEYTVKLQSGKVKVESLGGKMYFLSIVDDYSRRVWVYILRFKHEAFGKFKEWKQLVENQTERTVKKLRTDNGLEICNREFEQLCIKSGIARHLTVARTPEQIGLAERMNRTLMDKLHCLLIQSGLPKTLWAKAIIRMHILSI
ncbi:retrovirus-related pol polyprotein from transposon TNT 1-94, partial [Tanacetum coccineum]